LARREAAPEPSLDTSEEPEAEVRLFKRLVIGSAVISVLTFLAPSIEDRLVSEETYRLLTWHGWEALVELPAETGWLSLLLYLVAAYGLCHFSASARFVFTLLVGFFAVAALLAGLGVLTALSTCLGDMFWLAGGAILVMAYTRPLKERFA